MRIDWSWTGVVVALCALAATRQLREGTLQATRRWPLFFGGGWSVAPPFRLLGRWHLVGLPWLFTESVVLEPRPATDAAVGAAAADTSIGDNARLRLPLAVAHIVGLTSFLVVAFLLPVAVASHGLVGLILAVCVLANATLIASMALVWVEWRLRSAYDIPDAGFRIRLQSPFSVPYAAATVTDRVLDPLGAAETVRRLLPDAGLRDWLRPHVHDYRVAERRHEMPAMVAEILERLDERDVVAASARPERCLDGERYCPRCGSCYEPTRKTCADCPGTPALA